MTTYEIENTSSGQILGTYEADSPEAAIRAMLADAGCTDEPDPDLVATEVEGIDATKARVLLPDGEYTEDELRRATWPTGWAIEDDETREIDRATRRLVEEALDALREATNAEGYAAESVEIAGGEVVAVNMPSAPAHEVFELEVLAERGDLALVSYGEHPWDAQYWVERAALDEIVVGARESYEKWGQAHALDEDDAPDVSRIAGALGLSAEALGCVEEVNEDITADLVALIRGEITPEELLAHCLDGADEDREQGWREYVEALVAAAGR